MSLGAAGKFGLLHFGPDGRLKRRTYGHNTATVQGLTYFGTRAILDRTFNLVKRCGLIGDVGWSGVSASDQMANHPGWTELDAGSSSVRNAISGSTTVGPVKSITVATFFFGDDSGDVTYPLIIRGAFIVDAGSATPFDDAGYLWCAAPFVTQVEADLLDSLVVTYSLTEGNYPDG